jgi:hypothetical protein
MDPSLLSALTLGLLLGLRHALDADHVAAVSALVVRERGLARWCFLGTCWGAGHTFALTGAGVAMIAFRAAISPAMATALERVVGLVLLILGGHVLLRACGAFLVDAPEHRHAGVIHRHAVVAGAARSHVHLVRLGGRPFLVGMLHGMAGSAALTLLVLGTIPSPVGALTYLVVFGIGSTAGMLLLSGLVGLPLALAARRPRAQVALQAVAGAGSAVLGVLMLAGAAV